MVISLVTFVAGIVAIVSSRGAGMAAALRTTFSLR
jgi:hypothetical protein